MIRALLLKLIQFYQYFVSPFKAPCCRFIPTCSEYAFDAIRIHGPIRGLFLALARLGRCHPLHPGGYDPVIHPSRVSSSR